MSKWYEKQNTMDSSHPYSRIDLHTYLIRIYYTYHQHMEKIPGGAKEEQDYHNENFWGQTHYSSPPKFVG
jgi:hypothetical protein